MGNQLGDNKLTWAEYEEVVKYVYESLGVENGIKAKGYGRKCTVKGKSGLTYQIDVLMEQLENGEPVLTAIECKHWKDKVSPDIVMKLAGIMRDAGIKKGVIVTKTGYTRNAKKYALYEGIQLVKLREAVLGDAEYNQVFELGSLNLNVNATRRRPIITCVDFGSMVINDENEIRSMYESRLYDSAGCWISFSKFVVAFAEALEKDGELAKAITRGYTLQKTMYLYWKGRPAVVNRVTLTGYYTSTDFNSVQSYDLTDKAWLIMEQLLDQQRRTLSRSGLIWNLPSRH